jgi:pimeloyl-ACP methyl ester carboxylesterase
MSIAEVNGQKLYYEVHPRSPASAGQGAGGEGEPLLCVHGLSCDTLAWLPQLAAFSAEFRTLIFDNRDVGQSSMATGDYDIADMARDALGLADELELDRFNLLGISMGGAIAQEIAAQEPERVRTLTLAVTFPAGGSYAKRLAEVWGRRVRQISREQHVDELMLLNHSEEFYENAETVEWLRGMILQNPHPQPPEAFGRQLAACGRHNMRDRLGSLRMPTHVIGAERDILVPVWKSEEIASLIPGATLTVLPGATHGTSLERAEEFNATALGFIRDAAAAQAA